MVPKNLLSDTRGSLQPTGYTVVAPSTSGATRRYCGDTKVPVEPSGYTFFLMNVFIALKGSHF